MLKMENKQNSKEKCNFCEKEVTNLKRHLKDVHEEIKQYQCTVCTIWFAQNSQLSVHIKFVHQKLDVSNSRKFNCTMLT